MAYAALVSLAQTINQILNHDHNTIITPLPVNQEIISIRDHAVVLQSFLEDFPESANRLEVRIREAADTAEDVMDNLLSENYPSDCGSNVRLSQAEFERLREEVEKIKSTADDVTDYFKSNDLVYDARRRSGFSPSSERLVVGFDEDRKEMLGRVFGYSSELEVLSIVGMGGIGKTTLAQNVYNHPLIMEHFDIRGWVTVSQDYSVESILLNLLASMKGNVDPAGRDSPQGIQAESDVRREEDEIYRYLYGRRYLIVMDDMWSKKAWDDIKKVFPDNNNGSRIMLTTRLLDVAAYADPSRSSHMMSMLNSDSSWHLLRRRVFGYEDCPPELEHIGKRIAERCNGLPLSLLVVAGLLSKIGKRRDVWERIAASDGELETLTSLSYNNLPHHLKACFLYLGGFPEDYEIRVSELIKLWIADGFIKCPNDRSKSLEEEARECLEDLVERNLLLVTERKIGGKIRSCSLHDLVRDFCIRQGQRERLLLPVMDYLPSSILRKHYLPRLLKNHRRVSASWYDLDLKDSTHSSRTRSIICIPRKGYKPKASVGNFSSLRILHVLSRNDYWSWEPAQVFDLIYLTYLAFSIPTSIVPPAISKLHNLQTLIIYRSGVRFPVEIWRMGQLRHLIAFSFDPLPHPEAAALPLENLQTLSLATDFVCSGRMVEMIPNIQKLGICYSGEKLDEGYHLNNLAHLFKLEKLKLEMRSGSFWPSLSRPVFPVFLKKLTLSGCRLPWRDMTIIGSLPNLQVLKLRNYAFDGEQWKTTDGEFLRLMLLRIDESNVQHWESESSHFPVLKCLMLHRCPYLSEIPSDIGEIPTLELIEVDDLNKSLFSSAKMIEREQQEYGNDWLQVRLKSF